MEADNVGCASDLLRRRLVFNAKHRSPLWREAAAPRDHRHPECASARNHLLSDFSHANQSECAPVKTTCFGKFFLVPLATPQCNYVVSDATIQSQNKRKREFSDSDRILAGAVGNVDTAL